MSDLKPIEAGCLAISINCRVPVNNYKFVTVLRPTARPFAGDRLRGIKDKYWQVDQLFEIRGDKTKTLICMSDILPECYLLRIDDPDIEEESEEELVHIEDMEHE